MKTFVQYLHNYTSAIIYAQCQQHTSILDNMVEANVLYSKPEKTLDITLYVFCMWPCTRNGQGFHWSSLSVSRLFMDRFTNYHTYIGLVDNCDVDTHGVNRVEYLQLYILFRVEKFHCSLGTLIIILLKRSNCCPQEMFSGASLFGICAARALDSSIVLHFECGRKAEHHVCNECTVLKTMYVCGAIYPRSLQSKVHSLFFYQMELTCYLCLYMFSFGGHTQALVLVSICRCLSAFSQRSW